MADGTGGMDLAGAPVERLRRVRGDARPGVSLLVGTRLRLPGHQGCRVSSVIGGTIDCACHGSRFNAQTGAVVQGPATRALPVVPVTVQGEQIVRN